jgi:molecular chaperone GrpE (heat shock protein)
MFWLGFTAHVLGQSHLDAVPWLKTKLQEASLDESRGRIDLTVIFTTGHFGSDPALAREARTLAAQLVQGTLAKEDSVRVGAAELDLWTLSDPIPLSEGSDAVTSQFPTTPRPGSKGGRDLERALLQAVEQAGSGQVLLVLSPGPSQLAKDGSGDLLGQEAPELVAARNAAGYRSPDRKTFQVNGRSLDLTLMLPTDLPTGIGVRTPLPPVAQTDGLAETQPPSSTDEDQAWPASVILPVALICLVGGFAAGWRTRRTPKEPQIDPVQTATPVPDAAPEVSEELKKARKVLDMLAQDLSESSQTFSESTAALRREVLDAGELRNAIVMRDEELAAWDETAMEYLDSVQRALQLPGLAMERRETWMKAGRDFARLCAKNGLDLIAPEIGDPVVAGMHRVDSVLDGSSEEVRECLQWGYRRGAKVLRQATVITGPARAKVS